jgi:hypothetical protein
MMTMILTYNLPTIALAVRNGILSFKPKAMYLRMLVFGVMFLAPDLSLCITWSIL